MKTLSKTTLMLVLGSSLILTGCGKAPTKDLENSTSSGQGKKSMADLAMDTEACDVFLYKTAIELLGPTVPSSTSKTIHSQQFGSTVTDCSYTTKPADIKQIKTATLLIRYAKDEQESKQIFADAKDQSTSLSGVEPEDVIGYGDEAYWSGGTLKQLNVRRGKGWHIFSAYLKNEDPKPFILQMADKILNKK